MKIYMTRSVSARISSTNQRVDRSKDCFEQHLPKMMKHTFYLTLKIIEISRMKLPELFEHGICYDLINSYYSSVVHVTTRLRAG
jgi:hypothetical protein